MKRYFLAIAIFVIGMAASVHSAGGPPQGSNKLAPWVVEHTAAGREAEFLVIMRDQADLSGASNFISKQQKGRFVRDTLWNKAQASQSPLLAWLRERRVEHRSFYIVNMVWVKAGRAVADEIAARDDVARIEGNPEIRNVLTVTPQPADVGPAPQSPSAIEPGLTYVRAPEVWAQGFTGQGIVVASADTGVQWDHPALRPKYRGDNGTVVNHDFNWHDSIHSGGGSCGPNAPQPCDDNNHGTHTTGTAVGDDGAANQIGMAPGAKFIACRNMNQGVGTPATYTECMEFFLAPYPVNGNPAQGEPNLAPDITINSWGCPPGEGCSPLTLQSAVEAQRAAGIMMVVAAGNSGSGCSTVVDPPSLYDHNYTVGAFSSSTGNIASFSSRGPVALDQSNRVKPDISAPGVSVRSSIRGGGFSSFNGTSMATPHVAGAVALLWSARPALRNQVALTEDILNDAAVEVATTNCSSNGTPNNVYGFGRLDVKAAVDLAAFALAPRRQSFTDAGGNAQIAITAPDGANWTAVSNDAFITITGGGSGTGNGTVMYTVTPNAGATPRFGTLTVAGHTFKVYQGIGFLDVPPSHPFYNEISKLSAHGITVGCGGGNFCPDAPVTREQMAAFIERALGVPIAPTPPSQRFQDVPPSNIFYAYIEDLARRGITQGCQASPPLYCPDNFVTREEMAIFIIRALGEFNPPPPAMQRFQDVGPGRIGYAFIDQMALRQITLGCSATPPLYCPDANVTRAQMAAFLVRAFGL